MAWASGAATAAGMAGAASCGAGALKRKLQNTTTAAASAHNRKVVRRTGQRLGVKRLIARLSFSAQPTQALFAHVKHSMTFANHLVHTTRRRVAAGFTLIELMVVLVIIGVLAALIVPNVLDRADDARTTAARTDVTNLMQALKLYRLDNQRYPTSEQGLQALVARPTSGPAPINWKPYLEKLPNDPWGRPYQYLSPGIKGEVDVMSFGADGQSGGEGKDADIGSWQ